jgi:hypothetical protein
MTQKEKEQNLMIVAAVDGYAYKHGITASEALSIFRRHDIFSRLRNNYETLHTQSLDESAAFAEDVIARFSV